MSEWLFEYEFGGAEWALVVEAATEDEARARVQAMAGAVLQGAVAERVPVKTHTQPRLVSP